MTDGIAELHGDDLEQLRREIRELRVMHEASKGSVADVLSRLRVRLELAREAIHAGEADEADAILDAEIQALQRSFLAGGGTVN